MSRYALSNLAMPALSLVVALSLNAFPPDKAATLLSELDARRALAHGVAGRVSPAGTFAQLEDVPPWSEPTPLPGNRNR